VSDFSIQFIIWQKDLKSFFKYRLVQIASACIFVSHRQTVFAKNTIFEFCFQQARLNRPLIWMNVSQFPALLTKI